MTKPRILITNDDGIHAEGIKALEAALAPIGEVFVVAPEAEMSGASHSLTLARPLRIRRIDDHHWTVDGTPTDCVVMALNKILPPDMPPDICCSGINHGPNLGDDASYSGTVAGAMEATILGIPGIAFSLAVSRDPDFAESVSVAASITKKALSIGLPMGTLLNVNIPRGLPTGTRITTQGFKTARPVISEHTDPRGKLYYWIGEVRNGYRAEGGTDFEAIDAGLVSVTPMRADLTDHSSLTLLDDWNA
ncbi:MAG: 5'/3'-nucleotidase SurE [Pyrinomonadaceae bacterium]